MKANDVYHRVMYLPEGQNKPDSIRFVWALCFFFNPSILRFDIKSVIAISSQTQLTYHTCKESLNKVTSAFAMTRERN